MSGAAIRLRTGRELLRTRRLILREFTFTDAAALCALDRDARVTRYLLDDPIDSAARAHALIGHVQEIYERGEGLGIWHARERRRHGFVGYFSLMPLRAAAAGRADDVEIGVRLAPEAWGRHYALEGGDALCRYAFATLNLPRLVGLCHPDNRVVPLLLRRLGFLSEGTCEHFGKAAQRLVLTADDWRAGPRGHRRAVAR